MASNSLSIPRMEYLIDHIRSRLSNSPITHQLTITVIESRPNRTTSLFPYVEDTPKVWVQQVLVTVAADIKRGESTDIKKDTSVRGIDEAKNALGSTSTSDNSHSASSRNNGKLFLCAMEAYVFHVPTTSSCLVYISKVDSTGYHPDMPSSSTGDPTSDPALASEKPRSRLPPITYYLLKAFLSFYHPLPPSRALQIQRPHHHKHAYVTLFARSATQYLFPNSILGGKKVLGGLKLCKWWKRTFEDVLVDLQHEYQAENDKSKASGYEKYLTYCLPGYDHLEARSLIGISSLSNIKANTSTSQTEGPIEWQYLPPADPSLNSLLFPPTSGPTTPEQVTERKQRPLGMLVPTFDDDPKARFLVELVMNSPVEKFRKTKVRRDVTAEEPDDEEQPDPKRQKLSTDATKETASSSTVSAENDQNAAATTSSSNVLKAMKERKRRDEQKLRQQDAAALRAISWDDFWTRMGYRQECISGDVTGFFSMYVGLSADAGGSDSTASHNASEELEAPSTSPHQISHPLFDRIGAALLNHDFATLALAIEGTRRFLHQTENIVVAEIGAELWKARCETRVECNEKGKAFQERKPSDATDEGRVGGTVQSVQPVVNVLQVKKKKKPTK